MVRSNINEKSEMIKVIRWRKEMANDQQSKEWCREKKREDDRIQDFAAWKQYWFQKKKRTVHYIAWEKKATEKIKMAR